MDLRQLHEYLISQNLVLIGQPVFDEETEKWTVPVREVDFSDNLTEWTVKLEWKETPQ